MNNTVSKRKQLDAGVKNIFKISGTTSFSRQA